MHIIRCRRSSDEMSHFAFMNWNSPIAKITPGSSYPVLLHPMDCRQETTSQLHRSAASKLLRRRPWAEPHGQAANMEVVGVVDREVPIGTASSRISSSASSKKKGHQPSATLLSILRQGTFLRPHQGTCIRRGRSMMGRGESVAWFLPMLLCDVIALGWATISMGCRHVVSSRPETYRFLAK